MAGRWYAIVDTARDDGLAALVRACARQACLFSGALTPGLAAAAPYLVAIDDREPLIGEWRSRGAGRHWGILCQSALPLDALRKQLRRFLQARLPDGTVALFRFYDPRVFVPYMRAATPPERAPWFEGVNRYAAEGEADITHDFRLRDGALYDGEARVG